MVLNNTCECIHTLRKNAYGLVHARLCNGAAASLPWKLLQSYLESCANIMQAVVCHPPSCRLDLARTPPSPDAVRLRNPSKSTLAHDAVATAVLHKHHSIICVGAGLIQFVYESHSPLDHGGYPSQKCIFAIFVRIIMIVQSARITGFRGNSIPLPSSRGFQQFNQNSSAIDSPTDFAANNILSLAPLLWLHSVVK